MQVFFVMKSHISIADQHIVHRPYHYLMLQMLGIHSTASMEIMDPATLAGHEIEFVKLLKK